MKALTVRVFGAGDAVTEETHGTVNICILQIRYFIWYLVQFGDILFPVQFHCRTGPGFHPEFYSVCTGGFRSLGGKAAGQ